MTSLVWDETGEKKFQTGVDRGVLYLHDGTVAVWNGLVEVEEESESELKSFWLDGVKYLETLLPGDFTGTLTAFTYPDEFDQVNGLASISAGFSLYNQPAKSFNLAYRTIIGDDVDAERGYKIHILYNVIANPDSQTFETYTDSGVQPVEFSWALSGTPSKIPGYRPTVHISIDSTKTPPDLMNILEDILYGTDISEPYLPPIIEMAEYFGYLGSLIIVDHGDGTWSAIDGLDTYVDMLDSTTFQIEDADATYLDPETYEISTTNVDEEP